MASEKFILLEKEEVGVRNDKVRGIDRRFEEDKEQQSHQSLEG